METASGNDAYPDELLLALQGPPGEGLEDLIEDTYTPDFTSLVPHSIEQIEELYSELCKE